MIISLLLEIIAGAFRLLDLRMQHIFFHLEEKRKKTTKYLWESLFTASVYKVVAWIFNWEIN
jgi:hypothetical protein